jgi:hypothetical protein
MNIPANFVTIYKRLRIIKIRVKFEIMETILAILLFTVAFFLLSIGIIFKRKRTYTGCCGNQVETGGEKLTCGACPSKKVEVCQDGDKDGYATLAQLGNPSRKHTFKTRKYSGN